MSSTNQTNSVSGGIDAEGSSARSRTREASATLFEFDDDGERRRVRVANDIDASFSDSIRDVERDARSFDDALPSLPIPSTGEELDECGEEIPALFCSDCGETTRVGSTCRRSRCARCWRAWAFYRARTQASKLEGLRAYRSSARSGHQKLHHVVVSFPNSTRFDSKDALNRGYRAVKRLSDHINLDNGLVVYHPWRIREEHRGEVNGHDSGGGDMTWKDVFDAIEREGWDATRDEYLVYSPHFHVVGVSEFVQGGAVTEAIEGRTGVVVHRVTKGPDSSVSIYDADDLASVTAYALSHAGLAPDDDGETHRAAYRAFGELANFSPSPSIEMKVDSALRSVAPDVLGCDFPKPTCSEEIDGEREADAERLGYPVEPEPGLGEQGVPTPVRTVAPDGGSVATPSAGDSDPFAFAADATSSTWDDVPSSYAPDFLDDPAESTTTAERCGGQLKPISAASRYLESDEWCAKVGEDTVAALEDARLEFELLGRPEPETPPPPD